jgi:hypothetical protein
MLGLFNKQVVTNLILRNLLPCYHLAIPELEEAVEDSFSSPRPVGLPSKNEFEEVKSTITRYTIIVTYFYISAT